jgi:hypothetical protein
MRQKGTVVVLCVSYQASCHILGLKQGAIKLSWHLHCLDFVEIPLLKSSGDNCGPPLSSSLLDELSIDERDSDCFTWRLVVWTSSDSSCNRVDWLITAHCTVDHQLRFLASHSLCTRSADLACTCYYYAITCNRILVVILGLAVLLLHLHICIYRLAVAMQSNALRILHDSASFNLGFSSPSAS